MNFNTWLDTFFEEKGIDLERYYEIEHDGQWNLVPVGCLVEFIKEQDQAIKKQIKNTFVMIDFKNGDCYHYIEFLINGMVRCSQ